MIKILYDVYGDWENLRLTISLQMRFYIDIVDRPFWETAKSTKRKGVLMDPLI